MPSRARGKACTAQAQRGRPKPPPMCTACPWPRRLAATGHFFLADALAGVFVALAGLFAAAASHTVLVMSRATT